MDFCETCNNLLYLKSLPEADGDTNPNAPQTRLVKHCKCCGFEKVETNIRAFKVSSTLYSEDDLLYAQSQNKYLRYDPTLPRVSDKEIMCKNPDCTGPHDKPQVLYVKYHPVHLKFLYMCDYCGHTWKA